MGLSATIEEAIADLVEFTAGLGDYRDEVVLIGGLVPLLYRYDERFNRPRQGPLLTTDLDLTVPNSLPVHGSQELRSQLEENGFVLISSRSVGRSDEPKQFFQSQHRGESELAEIHAEFLTPLTGSSTDRSGDPKSPIEVQDGLRAEALRYLDVLRWEPMRLDLGDISEIEVTNPHEIQLPRPSSFIVQKALCAERRDPRERGDKDLAYIYDVATLTHGRWGEVKEGADALRSEKSEWGRWVDDAFENLAGWFLASSGSGASRVARQYAQGGNVNVDGVDRVMDQCLEALAVGSE